MTTAEQNSKAGAPADGSADVVYAAAATRTFQLDRSHSLLFGEGMEGAVAVPRIVSLVIGLCASPRTLAGHERSIIAHMNNADADEVKVLLAALIQDRLLRPVETPGVAAGQRVETIVIRTADQPQLFERCVSSFIRQMTSNKTRLLVVDHSVDPRAAEANRTILQTAAADCGDVTLDYAHQSALARWPALARIGAPPDVLSFLGVEPGVIDRATAARNLALLLTAGERILLLEESSVCSPWVSPARVQGLRIAGHDDPRSYAFCTTRQESLLVPNRCDAAEFVEAHAALLGARLSSLLNRHADVDMSTACGHMHLLVAMPDDMARVRLTAGGIAGDSGIDCPYTLLFTNGHLRAQLQRDRQLFDAAFGHRGARRVSDRTVVMHALNCDLQCLGIDNSTLVPPLPGRGRSGGATFGTLLQALDPGALMAYVPVGILDDPVEPEGAVRARINSALRVTSSEVLDAALAGCGVSPVVAATPAARADYLGRHLSAVGRSGYHDWRNTVRAGIMERRTGLLRDNATNPYTADADVGPYWTAAGGRYRNAFISAAESPRFFVPSEFDHVGDTNAALTAVGEMIAHFGELLQAWPTLWASAAEEARNVTTRFGRNRFDR